MLSPICFFQFAEKRFFRITNSLNVLNEQLSLGSQLKRFCLPVKNLVSELFLRPLNRHADSRL